MEFELTPDVQVRRDPEGKVRQLRHFQKPYTAQSAGLAAADPVTPRSLAEQYIRDVAGILELAPTSTANFAAELSSVPTQDAMQLRFKEEKTVENNTTVSYAQTQMGLPIWDAGLTVRLHTTPMQVTSSHNAMHYGLQNIKAPGSQAAFMPHRIEPAKLKKQLGLAANDPDPLVTGTRLLIYGYDPKARFDPQIQAHASSKFQPAQFPQLPLPSASNQLKAGQHFVVTEVLFTLALSDWGELNWRAFLDPENGEVLYLRALVACATGHIFHTDPVTQTGTMHTASTAAGVLDPLRREEPLAGLIPPPNPGVDQELVGDFVRLQNVSLPGAAMPSQPTPHAFNYSSPTNDFAAVNAYYHCDWVYRYIQGLGIDVNQYFNGTTFPVPVDPHGLATPAFPNGAVNAQARGNAMGNGMGAFVFGKVNGGQTMGIAADVRVVLHEFGHALLWDHVNSPNFGFAHSPGDSLAAILHDPDTKLTGASRFETFPFMNASSGLSRRHDRDVAAGWAWGGPFNLDDTQYGSEQILSTTMFRVYRAAGGDSTDVNVRRSAARYVAYLIIKGAGALSFTTPDPDVYVTALMEADTGTVSFEGHPGGTMVKLLRWSFEKQGLYQPAGAPSPVNSPGAPPEVDVFINDGREGHYMPYLTVFDNAPDIWNRVAADAGTANQPPLVGAVNNIYVKVKNRGTQQANNVIVRAFQSKTAAADTWPGHWKPATTPVLTVPAGIAAGGATTVGPFQWTPQFSGQSVLLSVSADGDRSHTETVLGAVANARIVPLDNNMAQRKF